MANNRPERYTNLIHARVPQDGSRTITDYRFWYDDPRRYGLTVDPSGIGVPTPAESAAGVTPVNYAYHEGDVKRYGAVGDGVTDDIAAFNSAAAVAQKNGGTIWVSKPPVQYLLMGPWNLTNGNTVDAQRGIVIRGEVCFLDNKDSAHILIKHTGIALDCAGTSSVRLHNLVIATDDTVYPSVGIFQARNVLGNSQYFSAREVVIMGKFSKCIKYNYGSEQSVDINCWYRNNATDAGACVEWVTAFNILGLSSTFISIATGQQSTIVHRHYGCDYVMNSTDATAAVFKLDCANSFYLKDSWIACRGHSYIYIDPTNGTTSIGRIDGVVGENTVPFPLFGINFGSAASPQVSTYWQITHCFFPTQTRAIYAGSNVTLDNFHIRNIAEVSAKGLEVAETMQGSTVDSNALPIVLAHSKYNTLIGQVDIWSIASRTNDYWIDCRQTKTFTAGTAALTVVGGITLNRCQYEYHGTWLDFNVVLTAGTSIACAVGTQLTGLPVTAFDYSGQVLVADLATNQAIGAGVIQGTSVYLPAIAATSAIVVTGRYRAN